MPVNRAEEAEVKAMENPAAFATEAATHVQGLVEKAKEALASMHQLVFPKLPQDKTFEEMAQAFIVGGAALPMLRAKQSLVLEMSSTSMLTPMPWLMQLLRRRQR